MNGKEALEEISKRLADVPYQEEIKAIKKDLDRLEELTELKQEIKDRADTEKSLTKWVKDLTDELAELKARYLVWDCSGNHLITDNATKKQLDELIKSLGCVTYEKIGSGE